MSTHQDDPRITAYVLDEMEPAERTAFEEALAGDPALAAEVAAYRELTTELTSAFAPVAVATPGPARPARRWMLAAAVVLGIGATVGLTQLLSEPAERAHQTVFSAVDDGAESAGFDYRGIHDGPALGDMTGEGDTEAYKSAHTDADVSEAAFEGPSSNGTIGIAGGAGGAFKARGGYVRVRPSAKIDPVALPGGGRFVNGVPVRIPPGPGSEAYDRLGENPFLEAAKHHTSTFSLDVDTASYANVRRFLMHQGVLPPAGAVRIEELVNYFAYDYAAPGADAKHPFATYARIAACPWNDQHLLARVAIKGRVVADEDRPGANLVFLVDVSGSMRPENKLPLVKQGLRLLLEKLDHRDKVAIVTYAGQAAVALPSTSCAEKAPILAAIDRLAAGGSTNGEAGIELAYAEAKAGFVPGGINRVMLATDGDFNVGNTSRDVLIEQIKRRAKAGTYLTILGFGMGNYKDGRMEALSNACNGTYAYIDSLAEAKKVLVEGLTGQLVPIAKDVKVQVFFNPKTVQAYRLIGYENRRLAAKDFNDDTKDAGDVGAGHDVTAFYEIVPVGAPHPGRDVDPNPFVEAPKPAEPEPAKPAVEHATALFQLRLRYQPPEGGRSTLIERMIEPGDQAFDATGDDFRFAAAVAAFGMKLRRSPHQGRLAWEAILEIAESAIGEDPSGRRSEFLQLVRKAQELMGG